jgi:serine/threonine protein kinase
MRFEAIHHLRPESKENDTIEGLLEQFPEELRGGLEDKISGLEEGLAADFLIERLQQRQETLAKTFEDSVSSGIEIVHAIPVSFIEGVQRSKAEGEPLGTGRSATVVAGTAQQDVCFKILKYEIVRSLQKKVVKEGIYQYGVHSLLSHCTDCAHVPEVLFIADDGDMQVLMMERVHGRSLAEVLADPTYEFPSAFDINAFFQKIERSVEEMHAEGYFHRDLTNNAGNVMIDSSGEPWIIDFGSTVKSVDPDRSSTTFQLRAGGPHIPSSDVDGVRMLRARLEEYLRNREYGHE